YGAVAQHYGGGPQFRDVGTQALEHQRKPEILSKRLTEIEPRLNLPRAASGNQPQPVGSAVCAQTHECRQAEGANQQLANEQYRHTRQHDIADGATLLLLDLRAWR